MTKTQELLLQDYISDKSTLNLKLFILSISQSSSYKTAEIKQLISKYENDRTPIRLKSIQSYLQSSSQNSSKSSGDKKKNSTPTSTAQSISYLPKHLDTSNPKLGELNEMRRKYTLNLGRTGSKSAQEENDRLRNDIDVLEDELNLRVDYKNMPKESAIESEKSILIGVLGHWEDPNSISFELLNGNRTIFEIIDSGKQNTSAFGMEGLLKSLSKFANKPLRPFSYQLVFPQGTALGKAKWVFSLSQQMSSVQMMSKSLEGYSQNLERL